MGSELMATWKKWWSLSSQLWHRPNEEGSWSARMKGGWKRNSKVSNLGAGAMEIARQLKIARSTVYKIITE
ncbi:hypothetical protein C4513_18905 [Morganella morganii]|nr:hypothetical protein [Morganella morganii]